ncbi:MAG: aminopeptidase P family protein [Lachnospiraceae bacterium]|nr:aminopeptidase P family protein [Lachnospiraceae bacterium]
MSAKDIRDRLQLLRKSMAEDAVTAYLIYTGDFHNSEYVNDYFKVREFFSGFTGSNGTLLVMTGEAGLWTDGRYFVQAERELEGSGITLYRSGEEKVPTIMEFLEEKLSEKDILAIDGRVVQASLGKKLKKIGKKKGFKLYYKKDYSEGIFVRPPFPVSKAELLSEELTGENVSTKINRVLEKTRKAGADAVFISKLDDIMWLFNIRGDDVDYNPVLMSYAYLSGDRKVLFLQKEAVTEELRAGMAASSVEIADYWEAEAFLSDREKDQGALLMDPCDSSYLFYKIAKKQGKVIFEDNPTAALKAVKNPVEISHMRDIYRKDSVALTKFIYRLLKEMEEENPSIELTENGAADLLLHFRQQIPEFRGLSFSTISAYGANAAMMHYEPSAERPVDLKKEHLLLVDSGGQYFGGTTDVTRTIVLGPISEEERKAFTLTAVSMLHLLNAVFFYGCTGRNLDILARRRMWEQGMDYKCGTGHGIGYILNVHEGPQNIRWKAAENEAVLEEGMALSDEPGVYRKDEFGIRTENILLVQKAFHTEDGQFMKFENLTLVPIDDKGIDRTIMTDEEISQYLAYQTQVCEALSPYLTEEENHWLRTYAGI